MSKRVEKGIMAGTVISCAVFGGLILDKVNRSAKAAGEMTETIRNLKRLATGVAQYLADNDDTFFPRDYVGALKPHVPEIERLEDPMHHRPFSFNTNLYGVKVKGVKNLDRLILFYTRDEPLENKAVLYSFVIFVDGSATRVSPTDTLDWLPKR